MNISEIRDLIKFTYERFENPDIFFAEEKFKKRCYEQYACERAINEILSHSNSDPEAVLYEVLIVYEYAVSYYYLKAKEAPEDKKKFYEAKLNIYKHSRNAVDILYNYLLKRRKQNDN